MHTKLVSRIARLLLIAPIAALISSTVTLGADRPALEKEARTAHQQLIAKVPAAKTLSKTAVAVLVFPTITKAGLVIGGQYGEGVLFKRDKASGYYKTTGASYGLQAGAQKYGYAMFFMNERALDALSETNGFEVGVGPSIVVVDEGMGKSATTMSAQRDIYAFIFSQKGLMAGLGLQGNRIKQLED